METLIIIVSYYLNLTMGAIVQALKPYNIHLQTNAGIDDTICDYQQFLNANASIVLELGFVMI